MKITAEQFVESLAQMSNEENAENCKSSSEQVVSLLTQSFTSMVDAEMQDYLWNERETANF